MTIMISSLYKNKISFHLLFKLWTNHTSLKHITSLLILLFAIPNKLNWRILHLDEKRLRVSTDESTTNATISNWSRLQCSTFHTKPTTKKLSFNDNCLSYPNDSFLFLSIFFSFLFLYFLELFLLFEWMCEWLGCTLCLVVWVEVFSTLDQEWEFVAFHIQNKTSLPFSLLHDNIDKVCFSKCFRRFVTETRERKRERERRDNRIQQLGSDILCSGTTGGFRRGTVCSFSRRSEIKIQTFHFLCERIIERRQYGFFLKSLTITVTIHQHTFKSMSQTFIISKRIEEKNTLYLIVPVYNLDMQSMEDLHIWIIPNFWKHFKYQQKIWFCVWILMCIALPTGIKAFPYKFWLHWEHLKQLAW